MLELAMADIVPKIQFRLRILVGDDIAIGPGKVDLLEAIGKTGSITAAAKALGMSYRRAWLLVDTMNRCFASPVVSAAAGGASGGRARLTSVGIDVVRRYRALQARSEEAGAGDLAALASLLRRE
jgi:molybdate transport system regulatory protein